ncbi:MAG: type II toxin-antitoxin system mRNA interferase toxin, RelE/StbE family [Flavobacteriaceae bacterium]|jgi:mRNA interferase YafQ|nr:type II toxin-antitoxin system mRNA interferase toxin, RelE/StbE family [Flavobacteriaceae bacterium]
MYRIESSNQFLKDLKLLKKRSIADFQLLENFIKYLAKKGAKKLDKKYKAHKLSGNYKNYWECHVKPDLLLIWSENESLMLVKLARTGTHSDLF